MEEFEREEIRPSFRIGFSIDDLEESSFEADLGLGTEQNEFELDCIDAGDEQAEEDEEDEDDDDL